MQAQAFLQKVGRMLEVKDSAGYEWEEIKLPSSDNVNLVPPEPALVRLVKSD